MPATRMSSGWRWAAGLSSASLQADITKKEDRDRLLDAAPGLYGLVVFAGDPARSKNPEELESAMRQSMEVNYLGPILLAREAAERMRSRRMPGAIVLFS